MGSPENQGPVEGAMQVCVFCRCFREAKDPRLPTSLSALHPPTMTIDPTAKWAARQDWGWGNRPSLIHPKNPCSGYYLPLPKALEDNGRWKDVGAT